MITMMVILSCDNDSDLFREAIFNEDSTEIDELFPSNNDSLPVESDTNDIESVDLESRITFFPAVNDAYFEDGMGFNTQVNRLEEDSRISYLMFDLSQIESIGGVLTSATLEFTIHEDTGQGIIEVFKGNSNDWTENNLTQDSAPSTDVLLGSINKEYKLNEKIRIDLDVQEIGLEYATLVLFHKGENDLAFASQENNAFEGPKLKVVYETSVDADEIVIEDPQEIDEESSENETAETEEESQNEDSTNEESENDTSEEEGNNEESTEEVETEEEQTDEEENDTTEDESTDEEAEEEAEDEVTEEVTTNAEPIAIADATPKTGFAPLEVQFSGSQSSDDNGILTYEWNFKDGTTSSQSNPKHIFNGVGTYNVSLKVYDDEGKSSTADVLITVQAKPNEAPVAVATANQLEGDAPLEVYFRGSDSTDDKGISNYYWDFPLDPSAAPNNTRTFAMPGVYVISLTVTDAEGLQNTAQLTITVNESNTMPPPPLPMGCSTTGGKADDSGFKSWCWQDVNLPSGEPGKDNFSNGDLVISNECNPGQVTNDGNRLRFSLNPTSPEPQGWCSNSYNMRAEIRTAPWRVNHPIGTEEWFGWSYTFGDNYKIDKINPWLFFQIHEGTTGKTPMIALWCTSENGAGGVSAGEIIVSNTTGGQLYSTTGVRPQAGQTIDIVIRVIYGDENNGLLQIWIDGNKVHDAKRRTVHRFNPVGGNAKFGIYKWPWRQASGVQSSAQQGINSLETFMGPLRIITRKPGDPDYKKDSYQEVAPR